MHGNKTTSSCNIGCARTICRHSLPLATRDDAHKYLLRASEAGFSKIAAFFMALIWPILNDRPRHRTGSRECNKLYRHKLTAPQRARTMVSSVGGVCIFSSFGCRFKPFAAYETFENVGMAQNIVFWNLGLLHRGV